ncbi:hypothetical protein BOTBODRAFT_256135 [Botryobasidium botryosum FD-172 SS1]|uniref:Uncharacterized protein n=1 Tax=Botryobasidium botryosum (strain FD-172 SS1) TaxID=930990 RepID=A0A067LVH4_BOTB1|nr:hypothetical protein BOTBODRAFT_256135 [Botryobasidium botryosum FD-172 SS1]
MGLVISCLSILKGLFCKCFPGARSQVLPSSHPLSQVSQDSASIDTDVAATSVRHQSPPFQRPIRAQYGELVTGLSVSKDAATKALDTAFRVPRFLTVFGLLEEVNAALATLEYHR